MIFEVSVILGILGIYRGTVAIEFYRVFCIFKHKFYYTADLELRRMCQTNSILQK